MAPALKFDDCRTCRYRPRRHRPSEMCDECECGEMYEDGSIQGLRFDDDSAVFRRADKSLVTEDDEPGFNPDDLIERIAEDADRDDD